MSAPAAPSFADVHGFQPLLRAFRRARRAKRGKGGEPAFYRDLEANLLRLSADLAAQTWQPAPYRYFTLTNKKRRVVSEAAFVDRVVHHALVAAIEPLWEPHFIDQSYACRKGRGVHAAVARARQLAGRHRFYLRLDVNRYFDHVDHSALLGLLGDRLGDDGIMWLCARILAHADVPQVPAGVARGIPIGNLTSQFWANMYLDPLDDILAALVGPARVLRYMDDVLVFADDKATLWEAVQIAAELCQGHLRLTLKRHATVVAPVTEGIPWLGFRVFPGVTRVDRYGRRRYGRRLAASLRRAAVSPLAEQAQTGRMASAAGHLIHADTLALRQDMLRRACAGSVSGAGHRPR